MCLCCFPPPPFRLLLAVEESIIIIIIGSHPWQQPENYALLFHYSQAYLLFQTYAEHNNYLSRPKTGTIAASCCLGQVVIFPLNVFQSQNESMISGKSLILHYDHDCPIYTGPSSKSPNLWTLIFHVVHPIPYPAHMSENSARGRGHAPWSYGKPNVSKLPTFISLLNNYMLTW